MDKFTSLTSKAIPFARSNVDTDLIIPAAYLKTTKRTGLGKGAFAALRYHENGQVNQKCVFNDPARLNAQILVTGENFGCGSSREHAAWALADLGIKVIIAASFADIFASNAFKNGILAITLPQQEVNVLFEDAIDGEITIDLEEQKIIRPNQQIIRFNYDNFKKHCMMSGLDEIGLTLQYESRIDEFEVRQRACLPWLHSDIIVA